MSEQIELEEIKCLTREDFKTDNDMLEWQQCSYIAGFESVTEMLWYLYVECDLGYRVLDKKIGFDQRNLANKLNAMGVLPKPKGGANRMKYQKAA